MGITFCGSGRGLFPGLKGVWKTWVVLGALVGNGDSQRGCVKIDVLSQEMGSIGHPAKDVHEDGMERGRSKYASMWFDKLKGLGNCGAEIRRRRGNTRRHSKTAPNLEQKLT